MSFGCVICTDSFEVQTKQTEKDESCVAIKQCGHMFHFTCLSRWFKKSKTCPFCRAPADDLPHLLLRLRPQSMNNEGLFSDQAKKEEEKKKNIRLARMQNMLLNAQTFVEQLKKSVRHLEIELGMEDNDVIDLTEDSSASISLLGNNLVHPPVVDQGPVSTTTRQPQRSQEPVQIGN